MTMRDASEVIAEMRAMATGAHFVEAPLVIEWADALSTLPASTPPGDAVAALNAALAQAFADDPANACRAHAAVLPILQQLSTPQPAADDPCVRHACKRVRMEMQAEIERLRGLLRRWLALDSERDYVLRGETAAEVKGVSHAG